ncbi:transcription elongation factor GreB [Escherichia coli]|uniref:Transcription elongation factor GreB n=1 Tax=Escherichia coli TaxID=562 RepID=A0A377D959_ECOLX|nr:transcription elongation factor GreB [Escherichia coli]
MLTISIIKSVCVKSTVACAISLNAWKISKIVDYSPQQEGKVFFGAWVEIENDDGVTHRFRIVGYDEIFGRKDYISIDSPMARALLKKEVGDLAVVNTPAGEASWYVNAIEYVKP